MLRYQVQFRTDDWTLRTLVYPYLSEIAADMHMLAEWSPEVTIERMGAATNSPISGGDARWMEIEARRAYEFAAHRRGEKF